MNKCIDELTLDFLKKFVLGQKTNIGNPDEVIEKCISLAYKDMMDSGKYYIDSSLGKGNKQKTENNNDRKAKFLEILQEKNFDFSRDLITETCKIFGNSEKIENTQGHATNYGLAQKLVNMTFKYFYVFKDEINKNKDEIKINIDFSKCDCPLDSIIIGRLNLTTNYVWSKLTPAEYEELQNKIEERVCDEPGHNTLGRLLYDFINW